MRKLLHKFYNYIFKHKLENAVLRENQARTYDLYRETKLMLDTAIRYIERQSGSEHINGMVFENYKGNRFYVYADGKVSSENGYKEKVIC